MSRSTAYVSREPPINWWQFVPCATCNVTRQERCQSGGVGWSGPARTPHASRVRSGLVLHGTLWLLREYPEDVLGSGH